MVVLERAPESREAPGDFSCMAKVEPKRHSTNSYRKEGITKYINVPGKNKSCVFVGIFKISNIFNISLSSSLLLCNEFNYNSVTIILYMTRAVSLFYPTTIGAKAL